MLAISSEALSVIRRVTSHPALASSSGLRIAAGAEEDAPLRVCAVPGPEDHDNVVEQQGGRLFLEPGVADRLDGAELDASTEPSGRVQFVLRAAR